MENPEKLATYCKQDQDNKNRTQYVLDTTICKQTQITHDPYYISHYVNYILVLFTIDIISTVIMS